MKGPLGDNPDDATPLDEDTLVGLKPTWIATRADLNAAEEQNISSATVWAGNRHWSPRQILNERSLRQLHARMFGDVWRWAGTWRKVGTNVGLAPHLIQTSLRMVLDDARFWVDNSTYLADEMSVRVHHRLAWIHPFPHGNGRHARLVGDLLASSLGRPVFTWGARGLNDVGRTRTAYIRALQVADHDYQPLLAFAQS